jgi:hypothetical protein
MDETVIKARGPFRKNGAPAAERNDGDSPAAPTPAAERRDADDKSVRIQLLLPPQSVARLEALRKMTEAASASEVVRNAIRVYEGLAKEVHNGGKILIKESDGTLSQIKIF